MLKVLFELMAGETATILLSDRDQQAGKNVVH